MKIETKNCTILAEIAEIAGVGASAVSNWRARHSDFPKPIAVIYSVEIFSLPQALKWLEKTGRLP